MPRSPTTILFLMPVSDDARSAVAEVAEREGHEIVYAAQGDAERHIASADIVFGVPDASLVIGAERIRWLQVPYAGVDRYVTPGLVDRPGFTVTNARGVYGVAGAEHVLGMMLMFMRGLNHFLRFQIGRTWNRDLQLARRLAGQTLGIVGLGDIGSQLARRAHAMGMTVVAVRRSRGPVPDYVEEVWTQDGLHRLLDRSDHVALALPATPETRGMIGAEELAAMKDSAYLYNVGRGNVVDERALVDALQRGAIAGAGLDVFIEEPLPPTHPLWGFDNVLITPHLGADTPWDWDDAARLFARNLERYTAGHPLENEIDLSRGY